MRVCAFICRDSRVLLVQQRKADARYWLLPGGAVERGESLESAVRRELLEECGLNVSPLRPPLGVVESISPDKGLSRHVVHLIYAALVEADQLKVDATRRTRDPAISRTGWFSAAQLRELIIHPPLQDVLEEWLSQFRDDPPDSWPPFRDLGVRWI